MKKGMDIFCKLSEKIWIGLSNTRENMGHDDSLPYQADIYIHDADNCPPGDTSFKRVASIVNGGYGGTSVVSPLVAPWAAKDIQTLRIECGKHQMYWNGKPFAKYTLEDVCDGMAALSIDNPKLAKRGTLLHLLDDDPLSEKGTKPLAVLK